MNTYLKGKTSNKFPCKKGLVWMFSFFLCLLSVNLQAQENQVTGKVTDAENVPLPGINIVVKGTTTGTVTNADGIYSLNTGAKDVIVVFSAVGFLPQEFTVSGSQVIDVKLEEELTALDEIVVVGYGTQKKSLVTGAISSISSEDISNTPVQRAEQALQGKTAGVYVLPASGSPGAGMKVRIRGTGSNGSSNPLYIVDGVKYSNISFLDPNDIASVEVLKDAASSAIYGAEGANGVVIISSKKGKKGDGVVSYNFQYGIQSPQKFPELMNRQEYLDFHALAGTRYAVDTTIQASTADTKWLEEITQNAPLQKHHLSFSGGSDKLTYNASASYLDQDGVIGGDKANYKRITARLNTTYEVKDWIKVGVNLSYSNTQRGSIQEDDEFGGVVASALYIDPATPTHYAANALPWFMLKKDQSPLDNLRQDSDGRYFAVSQNIQSEIVNPLLNLDLAKGSTTADNVLGSFFVEINPFDGLTINSRAGVDYYHQNRHFWNPIYLYSPERNNSTLNVLDNGNTHKKWQWENYATYAKKFGAHNLSLTAGMAAEELSHYVLDVQSSAMLFEGNKYAEHFSTSGTGQIDRGRTYDEALVSYFGRVMYDYENRYMFQATFRRDAASSSMVPSENKWGTFPSFSLGWNISEEDFWTVDFINHFKLRGSWGRNGNLANLRNQWTVYDNTSPYVNIKPFPYLPALTGENVRYTDASGNVVNGIEPLVLANPDLTWETSEQTDIGLDLRMWDSRINIGIDYYVKKTKDLLVTYAIPAVAGTEPPFYNTGTVQNKGFEFDLGIRDNLEDFSYSINFNIATLKNEVTEFNAIVDRVYGRRVGPGGDDVVAMEKGEPLWYFRGYQSTGLDGNGMPLFADLSGPDGNPDGVINDYDKTNIGNPHPDLIYGANINLAYKGVDFGVFLQGTSGNDILNGWNRPDKASGNYLKELYTERGSTYPNPAVITDSELSGKFFRSDYFVYNASYLRVKQIQLGYTFPSSLLDAAKFKSARIYVSLDDFFTITKYPGMDPEAGSNDDASLGVDRGMYPIAKKLMFGLNVTF